MKHTPSQFFFSILTALVVGVGIAYGGIAGFQFIHRSHVVQKDPAPVEIKIFSTPSILSRFSRTLTYTAEAIQEETGDDITLTGQSISALATSSVTALAYSVQSLDKDNVLVERNAETLLPIASVTKLVTAIVAKKLFKDSDTVDITTRAFMTEGNTANFRIGEKIKVKDILFPLLMVSSNDAAEALAQGYDQKHGKGSFVKEMNEWVGSIGAYRTHFRDPSGLSPDNISTAHDLSLIAKWIKEHSPEIFDITLTKSKTVRFHTWNNPTHFLSLSSYTGGKNGYTTEAHSTNVSLFSLGSPARLYSVVILGSKQRDKDTITLLNEAVK